MKRIDTLLRDVEATLDALFATSPPPEGDYRQALLGRIDALARDCDGRLALTARQLTTQPNARGNDQ